MERYRHAVKTKKIVKNPDRTMTIAATAIISLDAEFTDMIIMELRGFPNGIPLDQNEAAAEKLSPGIAKVQAKGRGTLHVPCLVTIDADGNRVVRLK